MRPATEHLPKSLIPVLDRPFVDWQLEWLAGQGIDKIVFSVAYRGDLIRRHVGNGRRFGLEVDYVDEGDDLRGTAGAIRLAVDSGLLDATFLVVYGDSYLALDVNAVVAAFAERNSPVLMTLYRDPGNLERPNAVFERGMVTHYEKGLVDPPPEMRFVDYGMSVWERHVIETMVPPDEVVDLATLFATLSAAGDLAGYEVSERFYEIGSRSGLGALESYLRHSELGVPGTP
jgi:NDP-sugar pyrophosphorylase family protein